MSIDSAKKPKKGRPPVDSVPVNVRILESELAAIDEWRRKQPDLPTRPEAMRRLVEEGLRYSAEQAAKRSDKDQPDADR